MQPVRTVVLFLTLLIFGLAGPARLSAEIFTWTDKDGVIHLANRPRGAGAPSVRRAAAMPARRAISSLPSHSSTKYDELIHAAAARFDLDYGLVKAVVHAESAFNPRAVSSKGALGLMQLMPETAHGLGVRDAFNPEENILGGSRYLKNMLKRYNQDLSLGLAAYNAGPGIVDRSGGVPPYPETHNYIRRVKRLIQRYSGVESGAKVYRVVKDGRVLLTNRPLP